MGKTTVTVKAGQRLTVYTGGFAIIYTATQTVDIPTFEVAGLQRAGVIV